VAIISLDPNDVSYEIPANFGYSGGAQTTWLGQTLSRAAGRPEGRLHRRVLPPLRLLHLHHPRLEGGVRQFWTPLFDQYQVDLVINGHNHIYERTDPIGPAPPTTDAPIGSTVEPATQGTTYVTCGGAGKSLYSFSAPDSYEGQRRQRASVSASYVNEAGGTEVPETVTWSRVRYTGYCPLVVDVTPAPLRPTHHHARPRPQREAAPRST
jgi:hypothetical protein